MKQPKRGDAIYQEIENFADYEFTNCVAYEMAIRNDEVKEAIAKYNKIKTKHCDGGINLDEITLVGEVRKKYLIDLYMLNRESEPKDYDGIDESEYLRNYEGYIIKAYYKRKFIDEDGIKKEKVCWHDYRREITPNFKRPHFFINEDEAEGEYNQSKAVALREINLVLPKDELIAYISKIKDDFNKDNSIVQTPFELLTGETIERDTDKKLSKKLIADMFYCYDCVKIELQKQERVNQELQTKLDDEIQNIKNDDWYDTEQKKEQIRQEKQKYSENCDNRKIKQIFQDVEEKINELNNYKKKDKYRVTAKKLENYYYGTERNNYTGMKHFINDCKYKTLIS